MEYDTYRDPAGPLSASAQVLFGVIADFLTSLADVPADLVDLVSAGRALGHPPPCHHPRSKWRMRKSHHEEELKSEEENPDEGRDEGAEDEVTDTSNGDLHEDNDDNEGDEEIINDEGEQHSDDILPEGGIDRQRSLQLENPQTMSCEIMRPKSHNVFTTLAMYGGKMSKRFINSAIWLPTDLSLSLSKGFHNAPKLYNDPMMKAMPKVISLRSGFRAAGSVRLLPTALSKSNVRLTGRQEFRDGFSDGITGLVTQPRYGFKEKGAKGLIKGMGKGVGGVFLKPWAGKIHHLGHLKGHIPNFFQPGLWGLAGYPLSGLRRKLLVSLGKSQECQIIASRIVQGHEEMRESSAEERAEVVRKWIVIEETLQKTKWQGYRSHTNGHVA